MVSLCILSGSTNDYSCFMLKVSDPGNEVSFASPYLFNFAGRQDLAVSTSRNIARTKFKHTDDGLPGNSDSGAMQSWLLWNMIGLYPLTGQTTFLIHSPWFEHLSIDLGGGKELVVSSTGGDKDSSIYVRSLKVNGRDWKKNYLDWDDVFAEGGTMVFELSSKPNNGWFSGTKLTSPASQGNIKTDEPGLAQQGPDDPSTLYPLWLLMIPIVIGCALGWWNAQRSRWKTKEGFWSWKRSSDKIVEL